MRDRWPWVAFLSMCFVLVGLTGLFACFVVPVPYQRALARDRVLDQVLAAPDPSAFRAALGDSAGIVLNGAGTLAERLNAARAALFASAEAEANAVAGRIRLIIISTTLLAGACGVGIMLLSTKTRPG